MKGAILQYETPRPGYPEGALTALAGVIALTYGAALELWHIRSPEWPGLPGHVAIVFGAVLIARFVIRGGR